MEKVNERKKTKLEQAEWLVTEVAKIMFELEQAEQDTYNSESAPKNAEHLWKAGELQRFKKEAHELARRIHDFEPCTECHARESA